MLIVINERIILIVDNKCNIRTVTVDVHRNTRPIRLVHMDKSTCNHCQLYPMNNSCDYVQSMSSLLLFAVGNLSDWSWQYVRVRWLFFSSFQDREKRNAKILSLIMIELCYCLFHVVDDRKTTITSKIDWLLSTCSSISNVRCKCLYLTIILLSIMFAIIIVTTTTTTRVTSENKRRGLLWIAN
jgi:hypothetical protein